MGNVFHYPESKRVASSVKEIVFLKKPRHDSRKEKNILAYLSPFIVHW